MDGGILFVLIFCGFLAAIILVPVWLKERTKQSAHALLSQAVEKGQTLDPALVRQLTEGQRPQDRTRRTLTTGIILLALAGGFVGMAFALESVASEAFSGLMVPASILGALGAANVLLAIIDYASKKKEQ